MNKQKDILETRRLYKLLFIIYKEPRRILRSCQCSPSSRFVFISSACNLTFRCLQHELSASIRSLSGRFLFSFLIPRAIELNITSIMHNHTAAGGTCESASGAKSKSCCFKAPAPHYLLHWNWVRLETKLERSSLKPLIHHWTASYWVGPEFMSKYETG